MMKVSVLTVVLNNKEFIAEAINSVLEQDYPDIEYVIIDGASTDGTLEIIQSFGNKIAKLISGKDKGLYYAMNRGLQECSGDIIAILNSDDLYPHPQVISSVIKTFEQQKVDTVYGNLLYVERNNTNKVLRYWNSGSFNPEKFSFGWMPPHPSFFVKRDLYLKYGYFNTELRSAADYELMLRFLYKHRISSVWLNRVLVKMRVGGLSNANLNNRLNANKEDRKAWEINSLKPNILTFYLKPLRKLPQFIWKYLPQTIRPEKGI